MGYVTVEKGVRVFVEDLNPSGKKTIVLIHGWPVNHNMYEYQMDLLPKHGFRCIALDIRGFGASDRPWRGYSYDRLADDVRVVLDSFGCHDVVLTGFSIGGAIAVRYMARHAGHRVGKLALLAAAAPQFTRSEAFPYGAEKEQVNELIRQTYRDRPQMLTDFGKIFFASAVTPSFAGWFQGLGLQASGHATIRALVSLRDERLWDDLGRIHVHTGIFQGMLDEVVSPECAAALYKEIKSSELHLFERSGHAVFYDQLEVFNREFLEFVSK